MAIETGTWLSRHLGSFAFMGKFIADLGDILNMLIVVFAALGGLGLFNSIAGRIGRAFTKKATAKFVKAASFPLTIVSGAFFGSHIRRRV